MGMKIWQVTVKGKAEHTYQKECIRPWTAVLRVLLQDYREDEPDDAMENLEIIVERI